MKYEFGMPGEIVFILFGVIEILLGVMENTIGSGLSSWTLSSILKEKHPFYFLLTKFFRSLKSPSGKSLIL